MIHDNYAAGANSRIQPQAGLDPNSSGMVLVVVVILAAVAAVLAAGLHFASGSRITQVRQEMRFEKAFFVAEAGLERAKNELRYTNLNSVLTNGGALFGGATTNYGEGRFYAWIRNNPNFDPNPLVNTSHIVIIRSTGIVETATRVIESEVLIKPSELGQPGQADGAVAIYGTNTDLTVQGNSKIDGNDWNVDGTPVSPAVTTKPGVLYTSTSTVISVTGSGEIVGNPPRTNAVGMHDETYWYQFLYSAMSVATTYSGGSLGTRAAPIITILPMGNTQITGVVTGAGILIIPGYASLKVAGQFHYEGLVILEGDGVISAGDEYSMAGTAGIFGAMVCVGGGLDIKATGTADIKFSSAALDNLKNIAAIQQIPAQLNVRSWKEIKASSTNW